MCACLYRCLCACLYTCRCTPASSGSARNSPAHANTHVYAHICTHVYMCMPIHVSIHMSVLVSSTHTRRRPFSRSFRRPSHAPSPPARTNTCMHQHMHARPDAHAHSCTPCALVHTWLGWTSVLLGQERIPDPTVPCVLSVHMTARTAVHMSIYMSIHIWTSPRLVRKSAVHWQYEYLYASLHPWLSTCLYTYHYTCLGLCP